MNNLKRKLKADEIHARLLNWGRWLRYDPDMAKLGYPRKSPFVFSPTRGTMIADIDAEYIEYIVSTLNVSKFGRGELHAFILRVEYVEHEESHMPHASQRARDVRRRFRLPCAERTYYKLLEKAKAAVDALAEPLKG